MLCLMQSLAFAEPTHSDKDRILAKVGEKTIRESDFHRYLDGSESPDVKAALLANTAARHEAINTYLDLTVLAAKARKDGLDKERAFQKARQLMEMKTLAFLFQDRGREQRLKQVMVTDDDVQTYYQQHTNAFRVTPAFSARQILIYVKGNPAFLQLLATNK